MPASTRLPVSVVAAASPPSCTRPEASSAATACSAYTASPNRARTEKTAQQRHSQPPKRGGKPCKGSTAHTHIRENPTTHLGAATLSHPSKERHPAGGRHHAGLLYPVRPALLLLGLHQQQVSPVAAGSVPGQRIQGGTPAGWIEIVYICCRSAASSATGAHCSAPARVQGA